MYVDNACYSNLWIKKIIQKSYKNTTNVIKFYHFLLNKLTKVQNLLM